MFKCFVHIFALQVSIKYLVPGLSVSFLRRFFYVFPVSFIILDTSVKTKSAYPGTQPAEVNEKIASAFESVGDADRRFQGVGGAEAILAG